MLLSAHAIWAAAPQRREPNISSDDHQRRVKAEASRTASSSMRRWLGLSPQNLISVVVGAAHELVQLDAGVDTQLGERLAQMGFHGVGRDVQPLCH
jgi:hypothetical protein